MIKYILTHPIQYQSPLIRYLAKKKIDIEVFYRSSKSLTKNLDEEFGKKVKIGNNLLKGYKFKFLKFVGPNKVNHFFPLNYNIAEIFKKNTKVIWLHGIKNWFNLIIIILGKLNNKKIFVRDELNFHKKRSFLNKLLNKKFYFILDNFIDCYLSIGKKNKQAYLLNGIKRNKIFDMPYTVDNFFFKNKNIKNKKKTNFLFVGKLIPRKGCHLLLKAIYILNQRKNFFNQTNFLIVGDGVSKNELKIYAKNNNLDNVKFLGFKNQIGMKKIYAKSDVLIIPSTEENWGLVVNEAMASSLAILSSNNVLSAYDLVINDFNGFKFKNNNYLDLTDKIYKIFSNKRKLLQYQKNSFKKISQWSFKQNYEGLVKALKSQGIL